MLWNWYWFQFSISIWQLNDKNCHHSCNFEDLYTYIKELRHCFKCAQNIFAQYSFYIHISDLPISHAICICLHVYVCVCVVGCLCVRICCVLRANASWTPQMKSIPMLAIQMWRLANQCAKLAATPMRPLVLNPCVKARRPSPVWRAQGVAARRLPSR